MAITAQHLAKIAGTKQPGKHAIKLAEALNRHASTYGVTTKADIANALSNFTVETGGWSRMDENLNYSASRLRQVWPARFPTAASTKGYAQNPRALANKVYGGRMGNKGRPEAGWLYRGSGPGQVTGYDNFLICEKLTGIPFTTQPDLMRDPDKGMQAALALWKKFGMSKLANSIVTARKKWNGGTHGLTEVTAAHKRAMKLDLTVPTKATPVKLVVETEQMPAGPLPSPALTPVAPAPSPDKATVVVVQRMLWEKGYTEIGSRRADGSFDGEKGKLTDTAILAAKNENGFSPINAEITDEFLTALPRFPARKLSTERTNATTAEVAGKVPEARMSWWQQIVTGATTVVTSVVGFIMGVAQFFGVAEGYVDAVKKYAADVPGEVWLAITAAVALGMFLLARKGLLASKDAFNTAERR